MRATPPVLRIALGAVLLSVPSVGAAQARPPAVYVDSGACPFECCRYGTWTAREPRLVRARPDSTSPVVDTIPAGESVQAVTGHVRTVPAPFLVKRAMSGLQEGQRWVPGDTIWLLTYLGEGVYHAWTDSAVVEVPLELDPSARPGEDDSEMGVLLRPRESEWWVRIRRPGGTVGWVRGNDGFSGTDACGL